MTSSTDPSLSIGATLAIAPAAMLRDLAGKDLVRRDAARRELAQMIADRLAMSFDLTKRPWSPGENKFPR